MSPKDPAFTEKRLIGRLEKLVSSGNINGAKFVARELEVTYNRRIKDIDPDTKDPAELEERSGLLMNIGDLYRLIRDYPAAMKFYSDAVRMSGDTRTAVDIQLRMFEVHKENGEWDLAVQLMRKSRTLARKLRYLEGEADCIRGLGYCAWRSGEFQRAKRLFMESRDLLEGGPPSLLKAKVHMEIANIHTEMFDFKEAQVTYEETLKLLETMDDRFLRIRTYNNYGVLLVQMKCWKEARQFFEKEVRLAKQMGDRRWEGWGYSNISECLSKSGDPKTALKYAGMSEKALHESNDEVGLTHTYAVFGFAYAGMGDLQRTKEMFEKVLALCEKKNMKGIYAFCLLEYARTVAPLDRDLAIMKAKESIEKSKDLNNVAQVKVCEKFLEDLRE